MSNFITVKRIGTERSDYDIRVEVSYNDGSLRRSAKGYWCHVRLVKVENGLDHMILTGGLGKAIKLEAPISRFSQKTFNEWKSLVRDSNELNGILQLDEVHEVIEYCKEHAKEYSW